MCLCTEKRHWRFLLFFRLQIPNFFSLSYFLYSQLNRKLAKHYLKEVYHGRKTSLTPCFPMFHWLSAVHWPRLSRSLPRGVTVRCTSNQVRTDTQKPDPSHSRDLVRHSCFSDNGSHSWWQG